MIGIPVATFIFLGCAIGIVDAQQPLYTQCGGIGWTITLNACLRRAREKQAQVSRAKFPTTSVATSTSRVTTSTTSAAPQPSGAGPSRLIGKTPALGWNSWNAYQGNINEAKIRAAADALVSLGLKDAGYNYVNIDVSDAGTLTCAGFPGSLGYENIDAQTFAEWGIDYLKYDNCNVPSNWTDTYGGPDFDCNADVWTWGSRVGHSWRMSGDSSASWSYITSIIARNTIYLNYVDDMDMMEIGNGALTIKYALFSLPKTAQLSTISSEQRTHFAMWVALKSPILLGTDLSKLNATQLAIIKNAELLAFSQDTTVGAPAKPYKSGITTPPEYYTGKSAKGTHVFIMNVGSAPASKMVTFSEVTGLTCTSCKVHDMWTGKGRCTFTTSYTLTVDTHDTAALLLT
ncbi:Alpha galactosidase A [Rhizoctonia solani]|uniref:alpha-galactosidase n=1 Tax=Rhizoctonia solani TaxID=456999 RepID=A0A8H7M679_9AGAM|nr:Alpha galactosidase A [Rhizoctonia solani]